MKALRLFVTALVAFALGSCGGGGEMVARIGGGGSGAPPTTDVGVGGVEGFGSIIINGQHYDETAGQFQVDERPDQPSVISVDAVRLGMQMQFESQSNRISKATVAAEVVGPVSSVTATGLVVLGQTVRVNADVANPTAFDGFSALSDLAAGARVEVHGQRNAAGEVVATRIELRAASSVLRVAGTVTDVAAGKFRIGALTVQAGQAAIVPTGQTLANGQRLAVWTDLALVGGELIAKVIRIGGLALPANATLTVDGVVTDYVSAASFRVAGVSVDASTAVFVGGTASDLRNGRSVRASGPFALGLLRAARVEFVGAASVPVELRGAISGFVNTASAFRIRNTAARVTAQTIYVDGDASNLGNGVQVEAVGVLVNGVVEIARVEFQALANSIEAVLSGTVAAPLTVAQDGTRTFRLSPLPYDVKTTAATTYKNGVVTDLALGRNVKVKGTYNGTLFVADEIQFMDSVQDPPTFEVDGIAGNVMPAAVVVNGKTVGLTNATTYTKNGAAATAADLKNGLTVEIVAVNVNGDLVAESVEIKAAASGTATVRGIVSERSASTEEFLVGAQRVSVAGNPKVIPGNKTKADIRNGTDLEVEGTIANGLLTATRVKFK